MKRGASILLLCLMMQCLCVAQNKWIDSLKQVEITGENDTIRFNALHNLAFYYTWANPDSALIYVHKELLLANQLRSDLMNGHGMIDKAIVLSIMGNYSQALDLALNALRIGENNKNQELLFDIYTYLCLIYRDQGDFENAIHYAYEALKPIDNRYGLLQEIAFGHIASVFEKFNQLDSALIYVNRAFEIGNRINDKWSLLPNTIGNIYEKKGNYDLALKYYRQGIVIAKDQNVVRDLVDIYNGMANIFQNTGQIDSCIFYAKEIINISKKATYPLSAMEASNLLANLYKSENKKDSTIKYLEISAALKDSLFSREKQRQFQNISFSEQLRAQELEAAQQKFHYRIRMNAFLGSTFTLIVIAIFLFILIRRKQKDKQKIELAYDKLKSTQAQLIQSEKMASLGELTAGIAHEIQNPLNFVNNFSELNKELISEMREEIANKNFGEADKLAIDIEGNEDKISHHGKRAESIVKGMLQHSRGSSGQKELTDLNALADEYLRLSYHGLRAKDKSFNADFKMEADESIPKIEVVPQDIGRVFLNLINNAFYAVSEKAKQNPNARLPDGQVYKPSVVMSTRNQGNKVEIKVKDNGDGIPDSVREKVFQPFFTTKPAGQGTGLGLSISYDIVTRGHNGELTMKTSEGKGTEFIITLPV